MQRQFMRNVDTRHMGISAPGRAFSGSWSGPRGRVRRFSKTRGPGAYRVRRCSESHGSGRSGSGGFQTSRVGPGHPDKIRPARFGPPHKKFPVFSSAGIRQVTGQYRVSRTNKQENAPSRTTFETFFSLDNGESEKCRAMHLLTKTPRRENFRGPIV